MTAKRGAGRDWEYPAVEEVVDTVGLHPVEVYVNKRQTTISERVSLRPVYALFEETEMMLGTIRMVRWWDQYTVNDPEA